MRHLPLRIVSYNVRYFGHQLRGLASTRGAKWRIASAIAHLDPAPDIICLQEVESASLRSRAAHRPAHPDETQLEAFMGELQIAFHRVNKRFHYEAFYFKAHAYKVGPLSLYTTGLAVILNTQRIQVRHHNGAKPHSITHHHVRLMRNRKQRRICAHMHLADSAGHSFILFNTHLSLPTPFHRGYWSRREKMGFGINQLHEARTLATFVKHHAASHPFLVCGDFNAPPGSPVYRYLTEDARFTGAQEALGQIDPRKPQAFPTAAFARWRMHLDHLFSGGSLKWLDLQGSAPCTDRSNPFAGLSDHTPLIARFELPR